EDLPQRVQQLRSLGPELQQRLRRRHLDDLGRRVVRELPSDRMAAIRLELETDRVLLAHSPSPSSPPVSPSSSPRSASACWRASYAACSASSSSSLRATSSAAFSAASCAFWRRSSARPAARRARSAAALAFLYWLN